MRGPDGYAVCPLCHNDPAAAQAGTPSPATAKGPATAQSGGSAQELAWAAPATPVAGADGVASQRHWIPVPQQAWPARPPVEGKSPVGALARSWFVPGWGQGYVRGAAYGWTIFGAWVGALVVATLIEAGTFEGAGALLMLPVGITQVVHAYRTAKRWNAENNALPPQGNSGVVVVALVLVALVAGLVVVSAVVFVLVSNLGEEEPLDYTLLAPPPGVAVLADSEQQILGENEYFRQDVEIASATRFTYAFVSEGQDALDVCLAYPADEQAFASRQRVDCFFLESAAVQGQRTVTLPPGTYSVFTIGTYGDSALVRFSFWGTPA